MNTRHKTDPTLHFSLDELDSRDALPSLDIDKDWTQALLRRAQATKTTKSSSKVSALAALRVLTVCLVVLTNVWVVQRLVHVHEESAALPSAQQSRAYEAIAQELLIPNN